MFTSQDFYNIMHERVKKNVKLILKIYDVTTWEQTTTICTYIAQYLKEAKPMKFGQAIKYKVRNIFLLKMRQVD